MRRNRFSDWHDGNGTYHLLEADEEPVGWLGQVEYASTKTCGFLASCLRGSSQLKLGCQTQRAGFIANPVTDFKRDLLRRNQINQAP
jgi:hypothetical protein